MKKIVSLLLILTLLLSLSACKKELSPMEKLDSFIIANGTQSGEEYVLDCPEVAEKFADSDFTIAHMTNLKGAAKTEFKLIKGADGISVELIDSSITDNGLKMERSVSIKPDGTYKYYNGMVMNGTDLGAHLEGEIPKETYNKDNTPVITKSQLGPGAKLTDKVKEALKDYIDLTLDSYALVLAREEIGITLADVGYPAYQSQE